MNKPLCVARAELIDALCADINESDVPAFVKREAIERILQQLVKAESEEYAAARAAYEESVKKEAEKESK